MPPSPPLPLRLEAFRLEYNSFCSDLPTQVAALSNDVTGSWLVTAGNSFGTCCGWNGSDRFPSAGPTSETVLNWGSAEKTGTIPTEFGVLSATQYLGFGNNYMTGPVPSQLGRLSNAVYIALQGNEVSCWWGWWTKVALSPPNHRPVL